MINWLEHARVFSTWNNKIAFKQFFSRMIAARALFWAKVTIGKSEMLICRIPLFRKGKEAYAVWNMVLYLFLPYFFFSDGLKQRCPYYCAHAISLHTHNNLALRSTIWLVYKELCSFYTCFVIFLFFKRGRLHQPFLLYLSFCISSYFALCHQHDLNYPSTT